jgi:heptosyltransferase-3
MGRVKGWERSGRRLLVAVAARLWPAKPSALRLPVAPKILLLRVDPRLGNLVLLTPVLTSLRRRFPAAQIDVLGHPQGAAVLATHPDLSAFIAYRKAALLHPEGPLATLWRLRRRAYDVCMDLSNPTDPSATQMLLARASGARVTVGASAPGCAGLLHYAVDVTQAGAHEIDKRLGLLAPLPGTVLVRALSLGTLALPRASNVPAFVQNCLKSAYGVLNLGARLAEKRLQPADYAAVGQVLATAGLRPVLTFGPQEFGLAQAVARLCPETIVAPRTNVAELAHLMQGAVCVVSCDTGPMHLAVALRRPTFGLFVATDVARFGHSDWPHACAAVAGRDRSVWLPIVHQFVADAVAPCGDKRV